MARLFRFWMVFALLLVGTGKIEAQLWEVPEPPELVDFSDGLTADVPLPGGGGDERKAGWLLDAHAAKDLALASRIWQAHRGELLALVDPLSPGHGGSWNIPIMSAAGAYLVGDPTARSNLIEYLKRQLEPSHPSFHGGLMGREVLSSLYWWPAPTLGLVFDEAKRRDDQTLADFAGQWLRAYSFVIGLGAFPERFGEMPTSACLPGARTSIGWACNSMVAYWFERSSRRSVPFPPDWYRWHETWPARVTSVLSFDWLDADEARRLRQHRNSGSQAAWIVEQLQALDVRLRAPVQLIRYPKGFAGFMAHNTHGSTPPLLGVVFDAQWRFCSLWPAGFRGEGGRTLGKASASIVDGRLRCETAGAQWAGWTPLGQVAGDVVSMSLPLPAGEPVFDVTIDGEGARFTSSTSSPEPPTTTWVERLRGPVYNQRTILDLLERGEISVSDALVAINRSARNVAGQTEDFRR